MHVSIANMTFCIKIWLVGWLIRSKQPTGHMHHMSMCVLNPPDVISSCLAVVVVGDCNVLISTKIKRYHCRGTDCLHGTAWHKHRAAPQEELGIRHAALCGIDLLCNKQVHVCSPGEERHRRSTRGLNVLNLCKTS